MTVLGFLLVYGQVSPVGIPCLVMWNQYTLVEPQHDVFVTYFDRSIFMSRQLRESESPSISVSTWRFSGTFRRDEVITDVHGPQCASRLSIALQFSASYF